MPAFEASHLTTKVEKGKLQQMTFNSLNFQDLENEAFREHWKQAETGHDFYEQTTLWVSVLILGVSIGTLTSGLMLFIEHTDEFKRGLTFGGDQTCRSRSPGSPASTSG